MPVLTVGLTGGIGTGKTYCAKVFEELGIPVYYSDEEAKRLMVEDQDLIDGIKTLFGNESYTSDGQLNRAHLAQIIFADKAQLEKMNALVHPAVARDFYAWAKQQDAPYVIQESALVYEINIASRFNQVIVVDAPEEVRIQRVMDRDHVNKETVLVRMSKQLPQADKVSKADYIILNDGYTSVLQQVHEIHQQLISKTDFSHLKYPVPEGTKAIIFDLDGTLADTMPGHLSAWREMGRQLGYPITDQMILDRCGTPTLQIAEQMRDEYGWDWVPEDVLTFKNEIYKGIKKDLGPIKAIPEIMAIARAYKGVLPMAIGTGSIKKNARKALEDMGVTEWFPVVVTEGDVEHGKPHPETYLKAAEALDLDPKECLVFEDGPMGVESALQAGMKVWDIVKNELRTPDTQATS